MKKTIALSLVLILFTTIVHGASITLFNTGVNPAAAPLALGSLDPHWLIVSGPGISTPATPSVLNEQRVPGTVPNNPYAQSGSSRWINIAADGTSAFNEPYTFRLTFDLTGLDPSTATITGQWAIDNNGFIRLNGLDTGIGSGVLAITGDGQSSANWGTLHDFTLTQGFQSGANTLEFVMTNLNGPSGLQVTSLTGSASVPEPTGASLIVFGSLLVSGRGSRRTHRQLQ